ncbi:MAG: oligosaccharide flippase family protein [Lachnospiraceae bacterium]|nr:oligosaccharide flippase family protein [Lachnospiraceae bacterium]
MATSTGGSDNKKEGSPFSGFLTYFYGNFVVLLLGFVQTPIVTRLMSTDEYGRTGMYETAVMIIYIFAVMGLDQAYIRYYYAEGVDRKQLLFRCLMPSVLIVSVISLIYCFNADIANEFLFGKSGKDITALVVVYALISVFERFFFLDIRMQQNGKLYSNINIAQKVLALLTIVVAWYFLGNDFRVALYALAVPWGITTAFIMIRYYVLGKGDRGDRGTVLLSPSELSKTADKSDRKETKGPYPCLPYKELLRYGVPFIMVLLMEWLLSSCDRLALRTFSDFDELGIYTSAMKIIVLLLTFKNTFIAYWSPVAMQRFEKYDMEDNRGFFRSAYDLTQFLCVIAATGLILFRRVIVLLLGPDYRGAERMIPFLTLMPVFAMLFEIRVQSIKYSKKNLYLNIASLLAIIINIAGNTILVPLWGGVGASVTTGISYLVYFAGGSFLGERCIKIGYGIKKTAVYTIMLLLYCTVTTMDVSIWGEAAAGLLILGAAAFIDRKELGVCIGYVKGFFKHK